MHHVLDLSPGTTRVGVFDREHEPVLTVASDDTVAFQTANIGGDRVTPETTLEELLQIFTDLPPHAGGHTLTGPIAIDGARPGDTLRVDILELEPRRHGYNFQMPGRLGRGLLHADFPEGRLRHFEHDLDSMTVELAPGVVVPLNPFLGIIAVAPAEPGPHNSIPPGLHGGNMDVPEAGIGSRVHIPIQVDEALVYLGDAHSVQGHGEVCLSAIETAMRHAVVRFTIEEGALGSRPWMETDEQLITLGLDEDLDIAAEQAVRDMIALLGQRYGLEPTDAYTLCSAVADLCVSQAVNGTRGMQAAVPKAVFRSAN